MTGILKSSWSATAKIEDPKRFERQAALPRLSMAEWADMQGVCLTCSQFQRGVRDHHPKCENRPSGPVVTIKRDIERGLAKAAKEAAKVKASSFTNGIRFAPKQKVG